jgi:hypothetical protein
MMFNVYVILTLEYFHLLHGKYPIGSEIKVCAVNVDSHDTNCGYGESHAKNGHGTEVTYVQLD